MTMPENQFSVKLEIKDQKLKEDIETILSSVDGFYIKKTDTPPSCDLLILELGTEPQKDFQFILSCHASQSVREVFLTSSRAEPDVLIQALRAGAKEFFSQPIRTEEVRAGLLKFKERQQNLQLNQGEKRGKVIDVIGSKGGVGTTTIAVNLATTLAESKQSPTVALIDINLLFGEIPIFLNMEAESRFNWGEVAKNSSRVDSTYLMSVLSKHRTGVYVLPSPAELDGVYPATPEIMESVLNVMRRLFDFIVVDGGQSVDEISFKMLELSDRVLAVAVLNLPSLTNLKRLSSTFQNLGYPGEDKVKVVINRYQKKSPISLKEAEESLKQKIHWLIPNDFNTTMSAINQGKTLSAVSHSAEITKNLREFASTFLKSAEKAKDGKGKSWLKRK
jgi:pilus assembly protein CpaE